MFDKKTTLCDDIYCDRYEEIHGHYVIPGVPTPLARPRMGKYGVYDAQKRDRSVIAHILLNQHANRPWYKGPLTIELYFSFEPPASYSKKKKHLLNTTPHHVKPDLSNLIKFIEDAANGVLYKDDAQISSIRAFKFYGEPKTEIVISEENH